MKLFNRTNLLIAATVIFVALIGWLVWRSYRTSGASPFHVLSTNPALNNVTTTAPFLKLTYNRTLSASGLAVSSSPNIIKGNPTVSGDVLTINLTGPLAEHTKYIVTVNSISDATGDLLAGQTYSFTPKFTASPLPSDQQKAQLQQQALGHSDRPYSIEDINFTNDDALLNVGLTSEEQANFEYAVFQYGQITRPNITQASLDANSIQTPPRDPNSTSTAFTVNFTVTLDSTTYKARLDYHDESVVHLYLYNPVSGAQVFDSGEVDTIHE